MTIIFNYILALRCADAWKVNEIILIPKAVSANLLRPAPFNVKTFGKNNLVRLKQLLKEKATIPIWAQ